MKKSTFLVSSLISFLLISSCSSENSFKQTINNPIFTEEEEEEKVSSFNEENNGFINSPSKETTTTKEEISPTMIYFKTSPLNVIVNTLTKVNVGFVPSTTTDQTVTFSISDPSFAQITSVGLLTALKPGSFTLEAKHKSGLTATCKVTAKDNKLQSITAPSSIELSIGEKEEAEINYSILPADSLCNIKLSFPTTNVIDIIDNRVFAISVGKAEVIIYDDKNNNNLFDEGEINTKCEVSVHNFNVVNKYTAPSCTQDGKETRSCSCGCGKTKEIPLPATGHNLSSEIVITNATCTTPGKKKKICSNTSCSYYLEETIPATGHTCTVKEIKDANIAKLGDSLSKTQYYYKCATCKKITNKTFYHGHSDFLYSDGISNYFGNNLTAADNYRKALKKTINALEENKNTDFGNYFSIDVSDTPVKSNREAFLLPIFAAANGETYPWANVNTGFFVHTEKNNILQTFRIDTDGGYNDPAKRKEDMKYFDAIHNEIDPLIREDATDIEKALIIYLYTCNYISYSANSFFFPALKTKQGNCFCYSLLINHLAQRFNLAATIITNQNHAWNNINIDNKWYSLDCTYEDNYTDLYGLDYFCQGNNHESLNCPADTSFNNITPLNNDLIQLYKNNTLAGVFYNIDTALESINDKNANYKLILGIGKKGVCGMSVKSNYYKSLYTTNKSSCSFKTLTIESCCNTRVQFKAPSSFFNQSNITYNYIDKSNK